MIRTLFLLCLLSKAAASTLTAAEPAKAFPLLAPRGRVVVVRDANAITNFNPNSAKVEGLVRRGLTNLTGQPTAALAWRSLISTQDIVGIKVYSAPGKTSGTRPAVVAGIIQTLIEAGLPRDQIVIWDKHFSDLVLAGFFDLARRFEVGVAGSAEQGYDENVSYDNSLLGKLVWGDFEFGKKGEGVGRRSFVSKLVSQRMTRIINVTPLLNHNLAGVSGNLFGLAMGSVDNALRFETSSGQLASAIPEIYALEKLSDRVVLNIVDALICQYQGEERSLLHYSTMLGQLRLSVDPVALDVLSIQELNHQRELAKIPSVTTNLEIYTNASLLDLGVSDLRKIDVFGVP